ncbi:hypothetical protein ACLI1A_11145 [Flavobacterium sp. RHBU_3]|uniref:hypothetical protein n=1 Tax=Flavobacterium sp. RHBU_3 TaxID=3391184 RepID=UPI003984DDCF
MHTYLKPLSVFKTIVGYSSISFALLFLIVGSLFEPVLIIIGVLLSIIGVNIASTEGVQMDFKTKRYRTIWSVLGINLGKWLPAPDFEYVSVFRTNEVQQVNVASIPGRIVNEVIAVNAFYGNRHITFAQDKDKTKALRVADKFRMAFGIPVLDATGEEKVWLYKEEL